MTTMFDPTELFPRVPNLYEFPSIHADMVFDEVRVGAYRDAIRAVVKKGDVVADVGAGTGLLSFFCLQAGAREVHAIEPSGAILWAEEIARRNGFADRIVFHRTRACDVDIKVDVIVSELIGHLAFEEGISEVLSSAKRQLLVSGGRVIPQKLTLRASLVNEVDFYRDHVDLWREPIEGIDYSDMCEAAVNNIYVLEVPGDHVMSENQVILADDFSRPPRGPSRHYTFTARRDGEVNGLVLWFDANLTETISLSSNPHTRTHWQQCFAPFATSVGVLAGDNVHVRIEPGSLLSSAGDFRFSVDLISSSAGR